MWFVPVFSAHTLCILSCAKVLLTRRRRQRLRRSQHLRRSQQARLSEDICLHTQL